MRSCSKLNSGFWHEKIKNDCKVETKRKFWTDSKVLFCLDHGDTKHDSFFELGKISASPLQTQKRVGSLECSLYEPVIFYEAQKLTGYFPSTFFQQSKCLFLPWEARLPPKIRQKIKNTPKKRRWFSKNVFLDELFFCLLNWYKIEHASSF